MIRQMAVELTIGLTRNGDDRIAIFDALNKSNTVLEKLCVKMNGILSPRALR